MKERLLNLFKKAGSGLAQGLKAVPFGKLKEKGNLKWVGLVFGFIVLVMVILSFIWGRAPSRFDVRKEAASRAGGQMVTGTATTATLIITAEHLLDKPGGYLSNDVAPPSVFMDDMPSWEFGVLVQVRDMADSLRNDFSRSRSQSLENAALAEAAPLFNYHNDSWIFPSSESQYRKAIKATEKYLTQLSEQSHQDAQFYARADNLRDWLARVEKRLGGLSQQLGASVGQVRTNTDLAGDEAARQSTASSNVIMTKTPWLELDNVFFEARGHTWALLQFFQAIQIDFEQVLAKKIAKALVEQIIRELEGTQRMVWSPMILNGNGFGLFANHSLVMASYISRANAAVIDLRDLLGQG